MNLPIEDSVALDRWPAIDAFLAENYGPDYIMRRQELFTWQFRHPTDPKRATVLCAFEEDRLIGMLGYMPLQLLWGESSRPVTGAWLANWMVTKSMRNGPGILLMRRMQEMFPVVLGQGAGPMNLPIVARMGFVVYPEIPRFVTVFDAAAATELFAPQATAEEKALLKRLAPPSPEGGRASSAGRIRRATELADYAPDWGRYGDLRFGTLRNAAYLAWRYLEHPIFDYQVFFAGDARNPAVCVFRLEQSRGAASAPVGRILEFFAPAGSEGMEAAREALAAALDKMREWGCLFCDFYCSSAGIAGLMTGLGLKTLRHGILPTRLSPIQFPFQAQNLEIWIKKGLPRPERLDSMYVTKSDGDQDRPNTSAQSLPLTAG